MVEKASPSARLLCGTVAMLGIATTCVAIADAPHPSAPHSLVAIEFRDWPPSELGVSGGFLGVPDSTGRFPVHSQRFDKVTGQTAKQGAGAGNFLVFTDLQPGTYRVALFLLEETKMFKKLLKSKLPPTEDRCLVYGDTTAALTFTVKNGDLTYLGCVVRKMSSSADSSELFGSKNGWDAGNEAKAWKWLAKRKEFEAWRDLLDPRTEALEAERKRKT
jgi:hypothetical protein